MKKTICLLTDWFPTKENPYQGVFFREQALAVSDEYDFVVFRFKEKMTKRLINRTYCRFINEEKNITVYDAGINYSVFFSIFDVIYNQLENHFGKKRIIGIGRHMSSLRRKKLCKSIVNLYQNLIKTPFDVVYCVDAQKEAYYCQCLAEAYGKPYVIGEHAPFPWPGSQILDVNKYAMESANLFFAISEDKIRQILLQNIALPKSVYIGNLVDESKFTLSYKKDDIITFIIIAANSFYKNYDMFIQVMDRLFELAGSNFEVLIVGYGSNKGYSQNVDMFEKKVKESKFYGNAEMIPEVPHDEIQKVLHRADAFVMTSIQEGQPVSALEAACCGLPIFSTRCGGVEDYVDEKMGRIYSITDVEGMAQGLNMFINGELLFDRDYIRKQVVNRFGMDAFRNKFISSLEAIISD